MQGLTNQSAQAQPGSSILLDLEGRKDDLAKAIRRYQTARLSAPATNETREEVEAAENTLVEAWRSVIDLEGQLADYKLVPRQLS